MKFQFYAPVVLALLVGCGSKKVNNEGNGAEDKVALSRESAEVKFKSGSKEVATLEIEDTDTGILAILKSSKLQKGQYLAQIEDACQTSARSKNELPRKRFKVELGHFTTTASGLSISEFKKHGFSIGSRFMGIADKSVSLYKKGKKGSLKRIACAKIEKT